MEKQAKGITTYLLSFINLSFFIYFIILGYFTRPHYDDLRLMWILKENSIIEYLKNYYFIVSGRFVFHGLNGIIFKIILFFNEYRYIPIAFFLIGFGMTWIFTKNIFKSLPKIFLFNTALFFYNLYVLTNIDFAITNWLCAVSYYLLPPMALLLFYLISIKLLSIKIWLLILILSIFIGGSIETFTPVVLAILILYGIYFLKLHHYKFKETFRKPQFIKFTAATIIILICFFIVIIAPGNYNRLKGNELNEFVTPSSLSGYVLGYTKAITTFFYLFFFSLPYYLILSLLMFHIGNILRFTGQPLKLSYKGLFYKSNSIYLFYLLLSIFPIVYIWSGFGIQRVYTHIVFFSMVFICFNAFLLGYFRVNNIKQKNITLFLNLGLSIILVVMLINIYFDTLSAKKYAKSVDKRIEMLQELNKKGVSGIVEVDPIVIPYTTDFKYNVLETIGKKDNHRPVLYYISDTDTVPNEYAHHLKNVYGLNFLIQLKKK